MVDVVVMVCKNVGSDCAKLDAGLDVDVMNIVEETFGAKVAVEGPK